jgi:arsenate reductase (thioredoxin)
MCYTNILKTLKIASLLPVSAERIPVLEMVKSYIQDNINSGNPINLNFICTHNSRRSQLSQVWAQTIAHHFGLPVQAFSGGVEVTECNPRALSSLQRSGFELMAEGEINPIYTIKFSDDAEPIKVFSKIYYDKENPKINFAAIMTCSEADENCPFIPGADKRIPLRYEDPKLFDGTPQEAEAYDRRGHQIASELYYVFSQIQKP